MPIVDPHLWDSLQTHIEVPKEIIDDDSLSDLELVIMLYTIRLGTSFTVSKLYSRIKHHTPNAIDKAIKSLISKDILIEGGV